MTNSPSCVIRRANRITNRSRTAAGSSGLALIVHDATEAREKTSARGPAREATGRASKPAIHAVHRLPSPAPSPGPPPTESRDMTTRPFGVEELLHRARPAFHRLEQALQMLSRIDEPRGPHDSLGIDEDRIG